VSRVASPWGFGVSSLRHPSSYLVLLSVRPPSLGGGSVGALCFIRSLRMDLEGERTIHRKNKGRASAGGTIASGQRIDPHPDAASLMCRANGRERGIAMKTTIVEPEKHLGRQ